MEKRIKESRGASAPQIHFGKHARWRRVLLLRFGSTRLRSSSASAARASPWLPNTETLFLDLSPQETFDKVFLQKMKKKHRPTTDARISDFI